MSVVHDGPAQESVVHVPHHPHPIKKCNPQTIYRTYGGKWRCDNCDTENPPTQFPFHCHPCSYDLCDNCRNGVLLADVHVHQLYNINFSKFQNQSWNCSVCKNRGLEMGQTNAGHCALCNFYICRFCATDMNHPIHQHVLKTVNTEIIYPHTNGNWGCDVCGRMSRFNERYSRHCAASCEFDVCDSCIKEYRVPCHNHPLVRADPNVVYEHFSGNWRCDNCGSVSSSMTNNKPWHCLQCEYDLCSSCMQRMCPDLNSQFDVTGPSGPSGPRVTPSHNALFSPHLERLNHQLDEPKEPVRVAATDEGPAVETVAADDGDECIICLENPKNATLIHGDTGHLCCCWSCAQVLKKRGDTCPICRQRIDHVIKQFKA